MSKRYDPYLDSETSPNNGATTFDYHLNGAPDIDPLDRIDRVIKPDGTSVETLDDRADTTTIDEEENETVTTVDTYGRPVRLGPSTRARSSTRRR